MNRPKNLFAEVQSCAEPACLQCEQRCFLLFLTNPQVDGNAIRENARQVVSIIFMQWDTTSMLCKGACFKQIDGIVFEKSDFAAYPKQICKISSLWRLFLHNCFGLCQTGDVKVFENQLGVGFFMVHPEILWVTEI
jgi:hypothetical protein